MSINERSEGETASEDAPLDDQKRGTGSSVVSALELTTTENTGKSPARSLAARSNLGPHPVSGTTTSKNLVKQSFEQRSLDVCGPRLSPKHPLEPDITISNHSRNRALNCSPRVSPKWPCGLWRRGAIYQYRTRVPADLVSVIGAARINR